MFWSLVEVNSWNGLSIVNCGDFLVIENNGSVPGVHEAVGLFIQTEREGEWIAKS